jgi:hypothetical protein
MARGVVINELSSKLAGDLDLQGLLGLDHSVPPGCEHRLAAEGIRTARMRGVRPEGLTLAYERQLSDGQLTDKHSALSLRVRCSDLYFSPVS